MRLYLFLVKLSGAALTAIAWHHHLWVLVLAGALLILYADLRAH